MLAETLLVLSATLHLRAPPTLDVNFLPSLRLGTASPFPSACPLREPPVLPLPLPRGAPLACPGGALLPAAAPSCPAAASCPLPAAAAPRFMPPPPPAPALPPAAFLCVSRAPRDAPGLRPALNPPPLPSTLPPKTPQQHRTPLLSQSSCVKFAGRRYERSRSPGNHLGKVQRREEFICLQEGLKNIQIFPIRTVGPEPGQRAGACHAAGHHAPREPGFCCSAEGHGATSFPTPVKRQRTALPGVWR